MSVSNALAISRPVLVMTGRVGIIAAGIALRFWLGSLGGNFDLGSWIQAATTMREVGYAPLYADASRWNYTPLFAYALLVLTYLPIELPTAITGLLTLADCGIAALLWRWYGGVAACLFWLNPIACIITGYHRQFDNLAILVGMVALRFL